MVRRASRKGKTPRVARGGLASVEAVMSTAITFPAAVFLLVLGVRACKSLFHTIGVLVGWPYL
jgi:hypothetical protein